MDTKDLDRDGHNIDDHAQMDELIDDIILSSISVSQSKQVSTFMTKNSCDFNLHS